VRLIVAILLVALVAGCNKPAHEQTLSAVPKAPQEIAGPTAVAPTAGRDGDVLVTVNGATFTRAEAGKQADKFLAANGAKLSPEQAQKIRKRLIDNAVEQFVGQTLIMKEIERQNIQVTKEEESAMYKEVAASLPPGMTIEEIIKKNPDLEQQIREQVLMMIKADKVLGARVKVSDTELSEFIEKNKERLTLPENVHARHILIATSEKDDEKAKAEKKTKAEEVRKSLLGGADFGDLAEKFSDCPSKEMGGDLGVFPHDGPGAPVKSFADAAFSQATNAIGPVIETQFGYHIIQVLEHSKGGPVSQEQVMRELKKDKREKAMLELVTELKSKAEIKYLEPRTGNEHNLMGTDAAPLKTDK
jgi:peptidyl-prolyl cis-trans isomerase C